jgi:ubiquinone/menaquinone biosynthesis C-methylase UbiE
MDEAEFDRFADEYHAKHAASIRLSGEAPEYFHRYKVDDVADTLGRLNRNPARILDFGGGVGNSLAHLRRRFPDSEIVLIDPSLKSLEIAKQRHPLTARFEQFDGTSIPFSDASFDLVFAACVFHHIPAEQHVALLAEIRRVLASGGSLFVFEHNPLNPLTLKAVRDCEFDDNAVLIRAGTMRRRAADAGFRNVRSTYRVFFPHVLRALRPVERYLRRLPLGGQYFIHAEKVGKL